MFQEKHPAFVCSLLTKSTSSESILGPKRAPLPPQQMSFRSARLREPPLHAPAIPAVMADGTLPNSNVPRHPRSQTHAGAPDVRHPRNEPRQNNDSVLSRTRSSSDMKMDVDQDEVSKSGGRLSPLGVRNPGSAERSRPEFDLQHPSRTSSASERRPDLPLGTPSGPAALSRDSVKYVQSDNSKPDGRSGKEGDRVVRPAEPEKNNVCLFFVFLFLLITHDHSPDGIENHQVNQLPGSLAQTTYQSKAGEVLYRRRDRQILLSQSSLPLH